MTANPMSASHALYLADPTTGTLDAFLLTVRKFAHRLASRSSDLDADEIAQETVIAVWQALPAYNGGSTITTWATSITRNKIRDALKRCRADRLTDRMEVAELDDIPPVTGERSVTQDVSIEEIVANPTLTGSERVLVTLIAHGDNRDEIASKLGVSKQAVRTRICRLRNKVGLSDGIV